MPNLKWNPYEGLRVDTTPEMCYGRIKLSNFLKFLAVLLNPTQCIHVYTLALMPWQTLPAQILQFITCCHQIKSQK